MPSAVTFRRTRRRDGIDWRYRKAQWIDPFPTMFGTVPEKMVIAELYKRGVYFVFQADWMVDVYPLLPPAFRQATLFDPDLRPDILLPQHKVIIEVQGEYWHSMPDGRARDERKFGVYEVLKQFLGWNWYPLWEDDILRDVQGQVDRVVEIPGRAIYTGGFRVGVVKDDTAALRARNHGRSRNRVGLTIRRSR